VFYFSCECGSAVFFDELGEPWPIHDCDTSWARGLQRIRDPDGRITVRLSQYVTVTRRPQFTGIDPDLVARARRLDSTPPPIVAISATAGIRRDVLGILREIYRGRDPLKSFGLNDTAMSRAMLGRLGKQPVGQITVHAPSPETLQQESFTAFVPSAVIADPRIDRGIAVLAQVTGVTVVDKAVWFCDGLSVVG
jgi:hypothetical protein